MSDRERTDAVVTGLGVVSPIGSSADELWESLLVGRSGAAPVSSFDTGGFPTSIGCEVRGFDAFAADDSHPRPGRAARLAAAAGRQALDHAALSPDDRSLALCVGTTMGESCWIESWPAERFAEDPDCGRALELVRSAPERVGIDAAALLGLDGAVTVMGGACAAGNNALGHAVDLVRLGRAERVLAGGVDAFSRVAYTGFSRLGALAREACRPFSADREGLLLGEGAAMLVVESRESAQRRGAEPLGAIAGLGLSSDAFHIVSPDPDGQGAARAMAASLRDARLTARDVDYVSAHGTGTPANDRAEIAAMRACFGRRAVPLSSIKALTGHTLAAASAIEAVACLLALRDQIAPPTWNYRARDPDCDWDVVPNEPRPSSLTVVMNNAYAFGGCNTSLVLTHPEA